jgi:hypothetical protein
MESKVPYEWKFVHHMSISGLYDVLMKELQPQSKPVLREVKPTHYEAINDSFEDPDFKQKFILADVSLTVAAELATYFKNQYVIVGALYKFENTKCVIYYTVRNPREIQCLLCTGRESTGTLFAQVWGKVRGIKNLEMPTSIIDVYDYGYLKQWGENYVKYPKKRTLKAAWVLSGKALGEFQAFLRRKRPKGLESVELYPVFIEYLNSHYESLKMAETDGLPGTVLVTKREMLDRGRESISRLLHAWTKISPSLCLLERFYPIHDFTDGLKTNIQNFTAFLVNERIVEGLEELEDRNFEIQKLGDTKETQVPFFSRGDLHFDFENRILIFFGTPSRRLEPKEITLLRVLYYLYKISSKPSPTEMLVHFNKWARILDPKWEKESKDTLPNTMHELRKEGKRVMMDALGESRFLEEGWSKVCFFPELIRGKGARMLQTQGYQFKPPPNVTVSSTCEDAESWVSRNQPQKAVACDPWCYDANLKAAEMELKQGDILNALNYLEKASLLAESVEKEADALDKFIDTTEKFLASVLEGIGESDKVDKVRVYEVYRDVLKRRRANEQKSERLENIDRKIESVEIALKSIKELDKDERIDDTYL